MAQMAHQPVHGWYPRSSGLIFDITWSPSTEEGGALEKMGVTLNNNKMYIVYIYISMHTRIYTLKLPNCKPQGNI